MSQLVPAAIAVFRPDLRLLTELIEGLGERRIYLFLNGDAAIPQNAADLVVIRSPSNLGQGAALNAMAERAARDGASELFLLDQDSGPPGVLPEILAERRRARGGPVAVVAPTLAPPPGEGFRPIRYSRRSGAPGAVHFAPTSGSLLSIAAWSAVGPFRADYFIAGIDVEWGFRAWSKGYGSFVERDLTLVHRWGVAEAAGAERPQILRQGDERTYYYVRNAVDCLRQGFIPLSWRAGYGARLAGQMAALLLQRRFERRIRRVVFRALRAGLRGELGQAPPLDALGGR